MKQLNTMETFLKGFNIVRNGEIITLTLEEMSDFRYLEKALDGKICLECYEEWANEEDKNIIKAMMKDEEICFSIENDILDIAYEHIGDTEAYIIDGYIKKNKDIKM